MAEFSLLFACLANTIYLLSSSRKYQLFHVENSENVKESTFSYFVKFLTLTLRRSETERPVVILRIWDPSIFSLEFFCFFSPGHLYLLHDCTYERITESVLMYAVISSHLYILYYFYNRMLHDKKTLHSEVFHEYNIKFVDKRLSKYTKNKSAQADDSPQSKIAQADDSPQSKSSQADDSPQFKMASYDPDIPFLSENPFQTRKKKRN